MSDATRLNRRLLSLGGLAALAPANLAWAQGQGAPGSGACLLSPQVTEGPYYFDPKLQRSDIRAGRKGVPVRLIIGVQGADCQPLRNARVDVWHCDADGVYSGFGEGQGETFLRGHQTANTAGEAAFTTIYPGWYPGRTPHIHLKVILASNHVLTSQLYFPEALTNQVYRGAPYARPGLNRRQTNSSDYIARSQGAAAIAAVTPSGDGFVVKLKVGVDPRAARRG